MKINTPVLLSLNAGYVDTAGFLALQGLFTAHVTGNFVTMGAAAVQGTSGLVAKLLALPVFCAVVMVSRLISMTLERRGLLPMRALLSAQFALLSAAAMLAVVLGPFRNADQLAAVATGMVLVAAMAVQNAISKMHLGAAPPTTLMTGTATQVMIDLADLSLGLDDSARQSVLARISRSSLNLGGFAVGCAAGALCWHCAACWCFALPPAIAMIALFAEPSPSSP